MEANILNERQNSTEALKLLYIQRKLYDRSKRWGRLRITGVLVLGVVAPVVTFFAPSVALYTTVVAASWLSLSRTWFTSREKAYSRKAALIQNEFDALVFGIENTANATDTLTLEERADILPPESKFDKEIADEDLVNWYPFNNEASVPLNIAVAQRANAAYTDRLLKADSSLILVLTIVWIGLLLLVGIYTLSAFELVLGVMIPVLPGLLDNFENWLNVSNASKQRRSLAKEIEDVINDGEEIEPHITHWQQRTFELRLTTPYLPNLLYKSLRNKNEQAMKSAAEALYKKGISNVER